jgi:hypothetical protein
LHAVIQGNPQDILIFSTYLEGEEVCSMTAHIERAQFYRSRSASKKGTWLLPATLLLRVRIARARRATSLPSHSLLWHHASLLEMGMAHLLEFVGSLHIYLGPYRGNPISLYLKRMETGCQIGPKAYPWNDVVGSGETPNKAAADFEEKWKAKGLSADMYSGPSWEGGIKPEKPAPPKPPAAPKPTVPAAAPAPTGQPVAPAASPAVPPDTTPASAPALTAQPADKSS